MQRTPISSQPKARSINYFRYEMKDTNQLLKDLISCNMSDTLSRSGENKQENHIHDLFKQALSPRNVHNIHSNDYTKRYSQRKFNDAQQHAKQLQKDSLKYQDQFQNDQNQIFKDLINDSYSNPKRKRAQNPIQELILKKFYVDVSENQDNSDYLKPSIQKYKGRYLQFNGNDKYDQSNKQIKKQKKGLANISLRVKNIVSQHKKLTYKQVSDFVLQYSKEEIDQLQESQRIREIKNIKRRVYDALNVLVAVGILGKHHRCVCITEWTNIPGKKHSTQWQKINSKIDHLNKLKRNCADKSQALKLLVDKYNAIAALRNKHSLEQKVSNIQTNAINKEDKETVNLERFKSQPKQQSIELDKKLMFPVIVFCPAFDEDPSDKLTVQLQEQSNENYNQNDHQSSGGQGKKQKVKISGKNITILGDFDCALELDLEQYRNREEEKKLLQEIEQYANQSVRKKMSSFKLQSNDFREANIQDYFNDQMFESK